MLCTCSASTLRTQEAVRACARHLRSHALRQRNNEAPVPDARPHCSNAAMIVHSQHAALDAAAPTRRHTGAPRTQEQEAPDAGLLGGEGPPLPDNLNEQAHAHEATVEGGVGVDFELGYYSSCVPRVKVQADDGAEAGARLPDAHNEQATCLLQGLRNCGRNGSACAAAAHDDPGLRVQAEAASAVSFAAGEHAVRVPQLLGEMLVATASEHVL